MSVRSLLYGVASVAIGFLAFAFLSANPVFANSCSFACTATFIPVSQASETLANCNSDTQCADFCARTCAALGSPRAFVDRAHPSTCGTATPRACTPCSCIPDVREQCEGTDASACATSCNTTCSAYNGRRPPGVQSIACATAPAPSCVVPPPTPPPVATNGHCRFACAFSTTQTVRSRDSCTMGTQFNATALAEECTRAGLTPTTPLRAECQSGSNGNRWAVMCNRPTAVTEQARGTCPATPPAPGSPNVCLDRCRTLCGGRGMRCAESGVQCVSGRCQFACEAIPAGQAATQDDTATSCTVSGGAATCAARCAAFCGERGGTCASSPAASCYVDPAAAGTTTSTGSSATNRPPQISRTAPIPRVTFPDPFGGNLQLPQVIGNIVRILVGLCGVFFLGVFIYGGVLYMTSAGVPKDVQKGQQAIVNAVIGLVIVLFAYVGVSLVIQFSNQIQTGEIAAPDQSQNARDDGALQPGGTTRATGRTSQGAGQTPTGSTPPPEPGTPAGACRSFYGADPATCTATGGGCPAGVTDMNGLIQAWGRSFPAASRDLPEPAAACRTCLETGVRGLQGRYPGIDTSCVPALVNMWSTNCRDVCNPRTVTQDPASGTTGSDICNTANYNLTNPGCSRCITYWSSPSRAGTVAEVGCPTLDGKVAVWCAGAESPSRTSRPQSGGYCSFTTPRR